MGLALLPGLCASGERGVALGASSGAAPITPTPRNLSHQMQGSFRQRNKLRARSPDGRPARGSERLADPKHVTVRMADVTLAHTPRLIGRRVRDVEAFVE